MTYSLESPVLALGQHRDNAVDYIKNSGGRNMLKIAASNGRLCAATAVRMGSDLPACIERVAREQGAVYNPTPESVRQNLHADAWNVRAYLGTYMPRTVFEFMTVGHDMLTHAPIHRSIPTERPLRILDLGSGTGGAWMGLASALFAQGWTQDLEVHAVDGNQLALSKQAPFARAMAAEAGAAIHLVTTHCQFGTDEQVFSQELYALLKRLNKRYDFVLVSKHLSEFYCSAENANGVVYQALHRLEYALTPKGYLMMLDVTIRTDNNDGPYFPNLMARELDEYMASNPSGLRPVLPLPCALHASPACAAGRGQCFTQRKMHFCHSMSSDGVVRQDSTKVTYRVLASQSQARSIAAGYSPNTAYQVNAQRDDQACHRGQIVSQIRGVDGYRPLNQHTQ